MIKLLKIFKQKSPVPSTDFSRFFVTSKAGEKKKLLKEIIRQANQDQKLLYQTAS